MASGRPSSPSPRKADHAAERGRPERIGDRYRVLDELGRGGMAVVYRVRDAASASDIALKQLSLRGDSARDRETNALFEREFYTLAQLPHPSVIEVYDYGVDDTGPYYTMELLDGGDLSNRAPLGCRDACDILMQICSSLSLLHSRRMIHRDISPRNIRCSQSGRAKLIDFGATAPMGASGMVVGTPAFIAPEALHHLTLDARTDLFSLGATLYFALTGRPAFAARTFGELRQAWNHEPLPPSKLVAGIPPALDALLFALLSIEPSRRPNSAFEVMQRLSAIAGIAIAESAEVPHAYLATPQLVARDMEQRRVRGFIERAVQGQGGAVAIEGAAGVGRSHLLDASVLDGKTQGAIVLRVAGRVARAVAFDTAYTLAQQLLDALPEVAVRCAREVRADSLLFDATLESDAPTLQPLEAMQVDRPALQAALTRWFEHVCLDQPLMIAIDDVDRIDEASLALLAALAHSVSGIKLMLVIAVQTPMRAGNAAALDILRRHSTRIELANFTHEQTELFFRTVFGEVSQVALVADRIYKITAGNPRAAMSLAQYMLDRQLIRYADGQWILPAALAVDDLPATAEEALRARLQSLSPLALRLAQTQALALHSAWTRADYVQLVSDADHANLDRALNQLLRHDVLLGDGRAYTLVHHSMRSCLISLLSADEIERVHAELAKLSIARYGRTTLTAVYHLLQAGAHEHALDVLAQLLEDLGDRGDFYDEGSMEPAQIGATLTRAFELAVAQGRRPRTLHELSRHVVSLSVIVDESLYTRYAPFWLAQLERDSGLTDYRAADSTLDPAARLQAALGQALARHAATPEHERVYRVDEAIKFLALCLSVAIPIGVRTRDSRLLASLPGLLEPFAGLSPLLYALWQNLIVANEVNYLAQPLRAHARASSVYERLGECAGAELRYVDSIRHAVSYAIGTIEVSIGYPSAQTWIEKLDSDPLQRVNAMRLRRFLSLFAGDLENAERYRTRAEVLAVQASARQMFDSPLIVELAATAQARDLTGAKLLAERVSEDAARKPRMQAMALLAHGLYQRLRGDPTAALVAFERCLELENPSQIDPPPWLDTWRVAAAGKIAVLVELERAAEAYKFGLGALEQANARGLDDWGHDIERELALAEAKCGLLAEAAARIEALIERRSGRLPSHLALEYEARGCIAIWADDEPSAARYAALTLQQPYGETHTLLWRPTRLFEEARAVGFDLSAMPTQIESAVLGDANGVVHHGTVRDGGRALTRLQDPAARAQRALEMVCLAAEVSTGQLYLCRSGGLELAAMRGRQSDDGLDEFVRRCWQQALQGDMDTDVTVAETEPHAASAQSWIDLAGVTYQVLFVRSASEQRLVYTGVVALAAEPRAEWGSEVWTALSSIAATLHELGDASGLSPE